MKLWFGLALFKTKHIGMTDNATISFFDGYIEMIQLETVLTTWPPESRQVDNHLAQHERWEHRPVIDRKCNKLVDGYAILVSQRNVFFGWFPCLTAVFGITCLVRQTKIVSRRVSRALTKSWASLVAGYRREVLARTARDNIHIATTRVERFLSKHEFFKSDRSLPWNCRRLLFKNLIGWVRKANYHILTLDLELLSQSSFRFGFLRFSLKDLDIWLW
jgi:hypothetical protein